MCQCWFEENHSTDTCKCTHHRSTLFGIWSSGETPKEAR